MSANVGTLNAPRLSVIVATTGRPSLGQVLADIAREVLPGDEILVDVNNDCPWGHEARNRMMHRAKGDAILFMDDDDTYVAGAFEIIREKFAGDPERIHVFRMHYFAEILWRTEKVENGNISTQMFVVPNGPLGRWTDRYQGDLDFLESTVRLLGEPVWHEDVIATYRAYP